MKNIYLYIFILLTWISCNSYSDKEIVGDWFLEDSMVFTGIEKFDMANPEIIEHRKPRENNYVPHGYSFKEDNKVERFIGFWDCPESEKCNYSGNFGSYKLTKDSIIIAYNDSWSYKYRILNIYKDSMILIGENQKRFLYFKFDYSVKCFDMIDSITLEYESSWGYNEIYSIRSNPIFGGK